MKSKIAHSSYFLVGLSVPLAALLLGCGREPPPPPAPATAPATAPASTSPVQSVRKLDGAPARVIEAKFTADGASLLVLERRPPKDESAGVPSTYAVSRRPIAGGPAKDLLASDAIVIDFAPFGDGVLALQHPPFPPVKDGASDDADERWEAILAAIDQTALYRVDGIGGGAPARVSPEERVCINLVGAKGGQWAAFSLKPKERRFWEPKDEGVETYVLGSRPGEETTLAIKGLVRDISPDGSRLLVRRAPAPPNGAKSWSPASKQPPEPRDDVKSLVIVTVKDQAVTALPARLSVDGATLDTAAFSVSFLGDGLLFQSAEGDLYRSAIDGTSASRLDGPLPNAPDAGAPEDAGALEDAGAPTSRPRRVLGPKGTVFKLSEDAGAVVLSSLEKPGVTEPLARFEGPLAGFGSVVFDADEKRAALAILSDTSRNGAFEAEQDDASVFITDAAPGSLSFDRAKVEALADEVRPIIAAAAGVPAQDVRLVPSQGSVEATVELPWIEGEKAQALFDRAFVAARALGGVVTRKDVSIRLRVGPLNLQVVSRKDGDGRPYVELMARGIWMVDPEVSPLVLRDPVRTTLFTSSNETLTGTLENTGAEPTEPIEVFAKVRSGYGAARTSREITKKLGPIAPEKRVKFNLILTDVSYGGSPPHAMFRTGNKRLEVRNQYACDHSVNWLDTAIEVRAKHGAWTDHAGESRGASGRQVHLTAEQAALPEGERESLFRKIAKALKPHDDKFHREDPSRYSGLTFTAPGGGGWRLEEGKKIARYEGIRNETSKPQP